MTEDTPKKDEHKNLKIGIDVLSIIFLAIPLIYCPVRIFFLPGNSYNQEPCNNFR